MSDANSKAGDRKKSGSKHEPSGLAKAPPTDGREISKHVREVAERAAILNKGATQRIDPFSEDQFWVCNDCGSSSHISTILEPLGAQSADRAAFVCDRCRSRQGATNGPKKGRHTYNLSFLP